MKEGFETVSGEKGEQAGRRQRLAAPIQQWSEKRSDENGRDEIGSQSGCVFQAC